MGLSKAALRFIASEHRRKPLGGSVLTLGRQAVYATAAEVDELLRSEAITPASLPPGQSTATNIPSWIGTPFERYTSDVVFFGMLGLRDVRAVDVNDYEGAEIIWDLNQPVPQELRANFDLFVDSGTLEHVFDVRTAMTNLARMVRPGGRVVHLTPANNYCNHGFFQFSPTFFADFYAANQFRDLRIFIAEERIGFDERTRRLDLYELDPLRQPWLMMSARNRRLLVICVAEKGSASTADRVPTQSYYAARFAAQAAGASAEELSAAGRVPKCGSTEWRNGCCRFRSTRPCVRPGSPRVAVCWILAAAASRGA